MRPTFTVTELLSKVRGTFQADPDLKSVLVKGELSNFSFSPSDHLYFVIKDRRCQIRCVMFSSDSRRLRFRPSDGLTVIASGTLDLYGPKGDLQLRVKALRPDGKGQLYEALGRLKMRLHAEGLFDPQRRRPLPLFPRRVGVVTSLQGAVLHDIATTLRRRNPAIELELAPASVQGDLAPRELVRALGLIANRVELVIIARGGGSFEDLLAFNSEQVVRAVAACPVPIVSAVGHETDVTLCDLAADKRAPTPTAAAEMIAPPWHKMKEELVQSRQRLRTALTRLTERHRQYLERLSQSPTLLYPFRLVETEMLRLDEFKARLPRALVERVRRERDRLEGLRRSPALRYPQQLYGRKREDLHRFRQRLSTSLDGRLRQQSLNLAGLKGKLEVLSPLAVLDRGYAICLSPEGKPISSVLGRSLGDTLEVRLADGRLISSVTAIHPEEASLE